MNCCSKLYVCLKQGIVFFMLLGFLAQPTGAQSYHDAKDFLSLVIDGVISEIKTNHAIYKEDSEQIYKLIDQRIISSVDIELFSKLTLGVHWKNASETQRLSFAEALRDTMVRSYGKSLLLLSKVEKIDYPIPESTKQMRYQIVKTMLFFVGGQAPVAINYAMLYEDEQWVIFDLIIDGLSIGKQFRQNFDIEIQEKGLDALIKRLKGDGAGL